MLIPLIINSMLTAYCAALGIFHMPNARKINEGRLPSHQVQPAVSVTSSRTGRVAPNLKLKSFRSGQEKRYTMDYFSGCCMRCKKDFLIMFTSRWYSMSYGGKFDISALHGPDRKQGGGGRDGAPFSLVWVTKNRGIDGWRQVLLHRA